MNAPARVAAFGAGLAVAFTGAFGVGRALEDGTEAARPTASPSGHAMPEHGDGADETGGSEGHGDEHAGPGHDTATVPAGLSATASGHRLVLDSSTAEAGSHTALRFRILGPDGHPVTSYSERHEKLLHLVLVRRDLTGYQHLHPTLATDGSWTTTADLRRPGQWRVLADFDPAGDTPPLVLGTDLAVAGTYAPVDLPTAAHDTSTAGYVVHLAGNLSASGAGPLSFTVARTDGAPVDLQPHLGADGHLVVLRAGDLAYAHAHPGTAATDVGAGAQAMAFTVDGPGAGAYRLFFEFRDRDAVHTAAFTLETPGGDGHGH